MQLTNSELAILFAAGVFVTFIISLIGLLGVWEKESDKPVLDTEDSYDKKVIQMRKKP